MSKAPEKPAARDARGGVARIDKTCTEMPVFDRAIEELRWTQNDPLPADEEGNILPGNDPLDEDPNDNGNEEQVDPEDRQQRPAPEPGPNS